MSTFGPLESLVFLFRKWMCKFQSDADDLPVLK